MVGEKWEEAMIDSFGVKAKDTANKETERVTLRLSKMIRVCG